MSKEAEIVIMDPSCLPARTRKATSELHKFVDAALANPGQAVLVPVTSSVASTQSGLTAIRKARKLSKEQLGIHALNGSIVYLEAPVA